MKPTELYNQILTEIISIQEAQNCTQKEYVIRFGALEDRDDYEEMMYYFFDIDRNLSSMYEALYFKIIYFFEQEKQFTILNDFINKFKKRMFDEHDIREKYFLDDFDVEVFLLIEELRVFFYTFQNYYLSENDENNNAIMILRERLEIQLRSLDYYLKDKEINKEKDFKEYVSKLLRTTFPDCQGYGIHFTKKLKSYIPDLFIPECKSAIELKYADTKEKFKSCIESIDVDVKGYSDNEKYKYFYAVFFCNELFYSKDEIEKIWIERNFPKEWKYYVVLK